MGRRLRPSPRRLPYRSPDASPAFPAPPPPPCLVHHPNSKTPGVNHCEHLGDLPTSQKASISAIVVIGAIVIAVASGLAVHCWWHRRRPSAAARTDGGNDARLKAALLRNSELEKALGSANMRTSYLESALEDERHRHCSQQLGSAGRRFHHNPMFEEEMPAAETRRRHLESRGEVGASQLADQRAAILDLERQRDAAMDIAARVTDALRVLEAERAAAGDPPSAGNGNKDKSKVEDEIKVEDDDDDDEENWIEMDVSAPATATASRRHLRTIAE